MGEQEEGEEEGEKEDYEGSQEGEEEGQEEGQEDGQERRQEGREEGRKKDREKSHKITHQNRQSQCSRLQSDSKKGGEPESESTSSRNEGQTCVLQGRPQIALRNDQEAETLRNAEVQKILPSIVWLVREKSSEKGHEKGHEKGEEWKEEGKKSQGQPAFVH